MENFDILVPFKKEVDSSGSLKLFGGIATSTSLDRDNERMDKSVLSKIAKGLENATVFFNHDVKGLGVGKVQKAVVSGEQVHISVIPTAAKAMSDVIKQIEEGILKSFSIGGRILKVDNEFDDSLNKDIRVIKDVEMYEVSVVGVPANPDASIQTYLSKSLKGVNLEDNKETTDKDENKENPTKVGDEKKSGLLESPEFKKILSDFREEHLEKFASLEKQVKVLQEDNVKLTEANKAYEARVNDLHKVLDERVKSIQPEQVIEKDSSEKEKEVKKTSDEPVRFM